MNTNAAHNDVAKWMMDQIATGKLIYQEVIVYEIKKRFGDSFVYDNENGNLAIAKATLKAFAKMSGDDVVWERGERCWRKRKPGDKGGRQQD